MNVATMNHFSSNPNLTHGVAKKVAKLERAVVPQIK
jgi:hypothetical protein